MDNETTLMTYTAIAEFEMDETLYQAGDDVKVSPEVAEILAADGKITIGSGELLEEAPDPATQESDPGLVAEEPEPEPEPEVSDDLGDPSTWEEFQVKITAAEMSQPCPLDGYSGWTDDAIEAWCRSKGMDTRKEMRKSGSPDMVIISGYK